MLYHIGHLEDSCTSLINKMLGLIDFNVLMVKSKKGKNSITKKDKQFYYNFFMIHKMHKNYWAKFKNITIKIDLLVVVNDL